MILQIDIEPSSSNRIYGFYRIMYDRPGDDLPSYWMWNGVWHHRPCPNLNPPPAWRL